MRIKRIGTTENPLFQHQDGKVYNEAGELVHDREPSPPPVAEPEAAPETEAEA